MTYFAETSRTAYGERLRAAGYSEISTEIEQSGPFYYAEDYHQQYLHKNPFGYCGLGGTGVSCPVGLNVARPAAEARALGSSSSRGTTSLTRPRRSASAASKWSPVRE